MVITSKVINFFRSLKNHKIAVITGLLFAAAGGWLLIRAGLSFHPNFGPNAALPTQSVYFFRSYTENSTSLMRFLAGIFLLVSGFSFLPSSNMEKRAHLSWIILNALYSLIIFWFLIDHALYLLAASNPDEWLIGDWLINYQGGIVRRGLIGEVFLALSRLTGISYIPMLVILQMGLYLTFIIYTFRLTIKAPISPLTAILVYSPAFMLFPVLDPQGGFRKEILLFALLSVICVYLATSDQVKHPYILPTTLGLASIFLVLNHEILAAFVPYFVGAVIIGERGFSKTARNSLIAIIPSIIITVLIIFLGRGNEEVVTAICGSLNAGSPRYCTSYGAIASLGEDISSAHQFVLLHTKGETGWVYLVSAIAGIVPPMVAILNRKTRTWISNRKTIIWLFLILVSSIITVIPLLWVVADYGRLIYIHTTCLSLLGLLLLTKVPKEPYRVKPIHFLLWGLFFFYINGWRLIHYDAQMDRAFPIISWISALFN